MQVQREDPEEPEYETEWIGKVEVLKDPRFTIYTRYHLIREVHKPIYTTDIDFQIPPGINPAEDKEDWDCLRAKDPDRSWAEYKAKRRISYEEMCEESKDSESAIEAQASNSH